METFIKQLEICNPFLTDNFEIEYEAIQTDSKGQPLIKIKFKGKMPFSQESAVWFRNKMKSKSL